MTRTRAVAWRLAAVLGATAAVAAAHAAGAPLPSCPLRSLTGVPCPACGATTAALAVASLDLPGAVAASPAALVAAAATVTLPWWRARWAALWGASPAVARGIGVAVVVALAEAWQLARADLL